MYESSNVVQALKMRTTPATKTVIAKPLLAAALDDLETVTFPCLATPKIDGIRALRIGNDLVTRQFKPVRNVTIRRILSALLPEGSDGEIIVGDTFAESTSAVMSQGGTEHFSEPFTFYWFDFVHTTNTSDPDPSKRAYKDRVQDMKDYISTHPDVLQHIQARVIPLFPETISSVDELVAYEKVQLAQSHEGVMLRSPKGRYKPGRSTAKEGILLKLKKFSDGEAVIVEAEELFHNENDKTKNELGGSKRSTKKEGLVKGSTLGSLKVRNIASGEAASFGEVVFNIGTGFTAQMRMEYWQSRDALLGKIVKYKYFDKGSKDAPRFPVFLGFRDPDDM